MLWFAINWLESIRYTRAAHTQPPSHTISQKDVKKYAAHKLTEHKSEMRRPSLAASASFFRMNLVFCFWSTKISSFHLRHRFVHVPHHRERVCCCRRIYSTLSLVRKCSFSFHCAFVLLNDVRRQWYLRAKPKKKNQRTVCVGRELHSFAEREKIESNTRRRKCNANIGMNTEFNEENVHLAHNLRNDIIQRKIPYATRSRFRCHRIWKCVAFENFHHAKCQTCAFWAINFPVSFSLLQRSGKRTRINGAHTACSAHKPKKTKLNA